METGRLLVKISEWDRKELWNSWQAVIRELENWVHLLKDKKFKFEV